MDYLDRKKEKLSEKAYVWLVIYEERGWKILVAIGIVIALGMTTHYNSNWSCGILSVLVGLYTIFFWFLFLILVYFSLKMMCEG